MSVLIRGMEIPKSCSKCGWFDMGGGDGYRCTLLRKSFDMWNKISVARDKNCPLVEIPTPHGRLGDLDKLMTEFMDSDLDHLQRDDWKEVIQIVADAEVVIEAEGSEE